MDPKPNVPPPEETPKQEHPNGDPAAQPSPTLADKKPIPAGDLAVERFLISTDSEGGD